MLLEHIKSGAKSCNSLRRVQPGTRLGLLVVLGLQDLAATVETVWADVVTTMSFVHATLGGGFLVLLNSHDNS
jgi:hypothetical protein